MGCQVHKDILSSLTVSGLRQVMGQLHQKVEVSTSILYVGVVPVPEPAREVKAQHHPDEPDEAFAWLLGPGVQAEDPDTTGDPPGLDQRADGHVDQLIRHVTTLHKMAVEVGQVLVPAQLLDHLWRNSRHLAWDGGKLDHSLCPHILVKEAANRSTQPVRARGAPISSAEDVPPQELVEVEATDYPLEGDVKQELEHPDSILSIIDHIIIDH